MTFGRKPYTRPPKQPLVIPEVKPEPRGRISMSGSSEPQPKDLPVRSKAYLREVAKLACYRCKLEGYTQACHGDVNKAMQSKTSDLTAWPGCCARPDGSIGCHEFVSRIMSRDDRREFEKEAAAATRLQLIVNSQDVGKEAARLREVLRSVGLVK